MDTLNVCEYCNFSSLSGAEVCEHEATVHLGLSIPEYYEYQRLIDSYKKALEWYGEEFEPPKELDDTYEDLINFEKKHRLNLQETNNNLTHPEVIKNFRKHWEWLSQKCKERKCVVYIETYFIENHIPIPSRCAYCCAYAEKMAHFSSDNIYSYCSLCPIDWTSSLESFQCLHKENMGDTEGLIMQYTACKDWEKAAKIAKKISRLPARGKSIKRKILLLFKYIKRRIPMREPQKNNCNIENDFMF